MMILQLILFCGLFTLMVKIGVGNSALNGLYFYPKPVREKAYALGLTDRKTVERKRKAFMTAFFAVMAAALILIIRVWNGILAFRPAYTEREREDEEITDTEALNIITGGEFGNA